MPSKYSHSAVLADYSSRGLINLSNYDHVSNYESPTTQGMVKLQAARSRASSNQTQPQQRLYVRTLSKEYAASSENLQARAQQRRKGTDLYHDIQRRVIIDSDAEDDKSTTQPKQASNYGSSSPERSRSRNATTSRPQRGTVVPEGVSDTIAIPQMSSQPIPGISSHEVSSHSIAAAASQEPVARQTSSVQAKDNEDDGVVRLSSVKAPPSQTISQEGDLLDDRLQNPPLPPAPDTLSPDPTVPIEVVFSTHRESTHTKPTHSSDISRLDRQDSSMAVETRICKPEPPFLPTNADFDGFSDSNEPEFIRRLVVTGRGTTSMARHSFRAPPSIAPSIRRENVPAPITSEPRVDSRFSTRSPDQLKQRSMNHHDSISSLSSLGSAAAASPTLRHSRSVEASEVGVPSIVRSPTTPPKPNTTTTKSCTPQPGSKTQLLTRSSSQTLTTEASLRRRSQTDPPPLLFSDTPHTPLGASLATRSFLDNIGPDLDSRSGPALSDYASATAAADHLRSMRLSLAMQRQQQRRRPQSRVMQTHFRDSSTDISDDGTAEEEREERFWEYPTAGADGGSSSEDDAAIPPDIAKYRVRHGVASPLAQIEQMQSEWGGAGRVWDERVGRMVGVRSTGGDGGDGMERGRAAITGAGPGVKGRPEKKDTGSSGGGAVGFLRKLRERSKGRKKK